MRRREMMTAVALAATIGLLIGRWSMGLGVHASGLRVGGPTYVREVRTVTLKNFVCTDKKPAVVLWESFYCILGTMTLPSPPVSMDYVYQTLGVSKNWWPGTSSTPNDEPDYNIPEKIHLLAKGDKVILYGGFAGADGPTPPPAKIPNVTIRFEAVYQGH